MAAPIKCLLVDDVEDNLVSLEALLRRDDVQILKATSGPQALEILLQHSDVALALVDVQMPEMNGFELATLMRGSERTRHIPLIFVTAGSRDQHWQFKGYESGAVDFLYKPVDPHLLLSKANVFFELDRHRRALTRELRERTEDLRVTEMFMAVLSHDLRNPLNAMLMSAHVLQRKQDAEMVRELSGRIIAGGQRMTRMIEDLLDVTRIRRAGGLSLDPAGTDLYAVASRAAQELQASQRGASLSVTLTGSALGEWDEARLWQVASNLMANALQHGSPGRPVEVSIDGSAPDGVLLRVVNEGEIPPALLPRLFEPFQGRDGNAGRHDGLGLGLYIVHQVVAAHGGRIEVGSADGRTAFQVWLPRGAGAAEAPLFCAAP